MAELVRSAIQPPKFELTNFERLPQYEQHYWFELDLYFPLIHFSSLRISEPLMTALKEELHVLKQRQTG